MRALREAWNGYLPGHVFIKRGYGSCLLVDYEHEGNRPSIMIDRCRWIVTQGDRLAFYDYDISTSEDLALLAPYQLQSVANKPDHLTLHFGEVNLVLFWTLQSQEFHYAGIQRDSQEWQQLPKGDRENVTIFPTSGEAVGIEFEMMLNPEDYPWGRDFLRREAELSKNAL